MSFIDFWSTCSPHTGGGNAVIWSDIDQFAAEAIYTCYNFTSTPRGALLMDAYTAIHLIIEKCDAMQIEIDSLSAPAGLTMDTLINTMLIAEPEQVKYFIGLVDAYRASLWNKPFNYEFYSALARGFI